MTAQAVDFAHTRAAEHRRLAKAEALAAHARLLGVDADGLAAGTGNRRRVWKAAGLKRAPSEDTWLAVVDVLGLPRTPQRPASVPAGCCLWHPDRPGRLYLGGYRCDDCSPAALAGRVVPTPPAGTTAADRLAARGRPVEELEPWIREARKASPAHRNGTAAARARLAERVYLRALHNPGPAP